MDEVTPQNEEENWNDIRLSEPAGEDSSLKHASTSSSEESSADASSTKPSWFPGKFYGEAKKKLTKNKEASVDSNDHTNRNNGGYKTKDSKDMPMSKLDEEEEEETKKEATIVATVRAIRAKYLERQLVGKIFIKRLSGVITTAVTSFVTADNITDHLLNKVEADGNLDFLQSDLMLKAEQFGSYKRALSTTDTILNSLERRSLSWQGSEFGQDTVLTRGTILGISDPFVGLIGFSITLELSATITSLLASRLRFEAVRELALLRESTLAEEEATRRRSVATSCPATTSSSIFSSFFGGRKAAEPQVVESPVITEAPTAQMEEDEEDEAEAQAQADVRAEVQSIIAAEEAAAAAVAEQRAALAVVEEGSSNSPSAVIATAAVHSEIVMEQSIASTAAVSVTTSSAMADVDLDDGNALVK